MLTDLTVAFPESDTLIFGVRILLGSVMLHYGWPKIRDLRANAKRFEESTGYMAGWFFGTFGALIEVIGGIAMLTGVFVWAAALAHAGMMLLRSVWKILKREKRYADWSYDLMMFSVDMLLLVTGAGTFVVIVS